MSGVFNQVTVAAGSYLPSCCLSITEFDSKRESELWVCVGMLFIQKRREGSIRRKLMCIKEEEELTSKPHESCEETFHVKMRHFQSRMNFLQIRESLRVWFEFSWMIFFHSLNLSDLLQHQLKREIEIKILLLHIFP